MAYSKKQVLANPLGKLFYLVELAGLRSIFKVCFDLKGGVPDIEILKKTCTLELERYPIFKSVVVEKKGWFKWDLLWIPKKDYNINDNIVVYDLQELPCCEKKEKLLSILCDDFSWFSLSRNTPFFIAVIRLDNDITKLAAFFHHSACDASGCQLFLNDLFETYNSLYKGEPPSHEREPVFSSELIPKSFCKRTIAVFKGIKVLFNQGAGKKSKIAAGTSFKSKIRSVNREINREKMVKYIDVSKKNGITFTVFIASAYIRAFVKCKAIELFDTLSIMFNKNLRKNAGQLNEVQNRFSVFNINIAQDDSVSVKKLIDEIKKQFELKGKNREAENLISLLWFIDFMPARIFYNLWLKILFNKPAKRNILSMSNMGRVFSEPSGKKGLSCLGECEIETCFWNGQPIPSIGAFLCLCSYKEALFLSYDYFLDYMNSAEAEKIVDIIIDCLDETAEELKKQVEGNNG